MKENDRAFDITLKIFLIVFIFLLGALLESLERSIY